MTTEQGTQPSPSATTLAADGSFGFGEALSTAQATLDEARRVLGSYHGSKIPCAEAPLHFDSRSISVLAYKSAIERVRERFWTTTFLASGFWSAGDTDILGANLRMMARGRQTGATVRRLFLLTIPPSEEIQRLQDERMLLRKCQDFDGLQRFDQRMANLSENIERLFQHGCEVRVVYDPEEIHQSLPSALGLDPRDTEIAIYDDWRFDLFQGGLSGTIESVRGYTPVMTGFDAYRDALVDYFERLWEKSRPIDVFLDRLRKAIEYSRVRIDYHTSWLARYDHALPREDEALKIEELSGVRVELVRLERWGHIQRFLDVGTCTGRYPISLREAVQPDGAILAVDNDIDCVRFTQTNVSRACEHDTRFKVEQHDFCSPEPLSSEPFDLITCMMGTVCHFERQGAGPLYDDPFQRAIEKFARMLAKGGILFFSVWTEEACRNLRFLSIYTEEDKRRLAKTSLPSSEVRARIEAVGLRVFNPILLQDRIELYRCEWPRQGAES